MAAREIRAGKAAVELGLKDKLQAGLTKAQKRLTAFGDSVTKIGKSLLTFGVGFALPLIAGVTAFASTGDQLDKMSKRTGVAASALSELKFAAQQSGSSLETIENALRGQARFLLDFERGLSTASDVAGLLGVTLEDLKGKGPDRVFETLLTHLRNIKDPVEQAALAMKLFGRSGTEIIPLLNSDIAALREEAKKLGITLTDEDAAAAAELTDAMNRVKQQLLGVAVAVGSKLAPVLTELQPKISEILKTVIDWVSNNGQLIISISKWAAGAIAVGGALTILGGVVRGLSAALGIARVAMVAFTTASAVNPFVLIATAISIAIVAILHFTGALEKLYEWLGLVESQADKTAAALEKLNQDPKELSTADVKVLQANRDQMTQAQRARFDDYVVAKLDREDRRARQAQRLKAAMTGGDPRIYRAAQRGVREARQRRDAAAKAIAKATPSNSDDLAKRMETLARAEMELAQARERAQKAVAELSPIDREKLRQENEARAAAQRHQRRQTELDESAMRMTAKRQFHEAARAKVLGVTEDKLNKALDLRKEAAEAAKSGDFDAEKTLTRIARRLEDEARVLDVASRGPDDVQNFNDSLVDQFDDEGIPDLKRLKNIESLDSQGTFSAAQAEAFRAFRLDKPIEQKQLDVAEEQLEHIKKMEEKIGKLAPAEFL